MRTVITLALAALGVALTGCPKDTGTITKIVRGGRKLEMKLANGKTVKTSVSGRRTKVMIGGKKDKRKNIKVGMTCTFNYPGSGQRAK